ncbi:mitochondrial carrier [Mycena belliarum]|uniref:Mitochondrial carrier n=1 Tax=Mycena belliarum TaxID=1033014 RepID=A0AAD6U6Q5_9AGAR|nr:mitochondrial carrier [Mycena belliae]
MAAVLAILFSVLGMILSLGVLVAITLPFAGVLIRFRANYTPKTGALRLDGEDGMGSHASPDTSLSYFGMMARVYRIEGWTGLYKGLMPSIISGLVASVIVIPLTLVLALRVKVGPHGRVDFPDRTSADMWVLTGALSIIPALLLVPFTIVTNRAITTPHKLAAFDARAALRVLLSPSERAQPLRLYLAPGVALASVLEVLITLALSLLCTAVAPRVPLGAALGGGVPLFLLTVALLTPLQVLAARLTLQRRGPAPDATDALDATPTYAEEVVEFRTEAEPYTGLLDCGRKIVAEEGWGVLTRAWWLTALTVLLTLPALLSPGDTLPPSFF